MWLLSGIVVLCYMLAWYALSLFVRDASVVDIAWGPGFLLIAVITLLGNSSFSAIQLLVTGLVAVWAARLAVHIGKRKIGSPKDWRYVNWRKT